MKIIHLKETHSTQDIVRNSLDQELALPFIVIADMQTKGRGRLNRVWDAPPHTGLLMSFPIDIKNIPLNTIAQLSFVIALAMHEVLAKINILTALKWPNDIMLNNKKLAGILIEVHNTSAIIGIGLNLMRHENALPTAAFLNDVLIDIGDKKQLAERIHEIVIQWVAHWQTLGFDSIRTEWLKHAYNLGAPVQLTDGRSGIFEGLTNEGDAILTPSS